MKRVITRITNPTTNTTTTKIYTDYLPWHNEHSVVGTTYEMIINKANTPTITRISKEDIRKDLMWENSPANADISNIEEKCEFKSNEKQLPSFGFTQSKSPAPKEGLFKSIKKQAFKHLP
ncbi:unnamed protein product [Cunninghamella blakesleeana]